ncbi:plant cysteine oxidase 2-like [Ricinus communis]|uniref:plant cysteine oxidase 2-like n=1 Tax=Ricinus communis TaxID=3988 RepID=UPI00201B33A8|nr:plant cysteine oxidase 2-like [Ricinus communis]
MTTETVVEPRRNPVGHVHKVGYANRVIKKRKIKRRVTKRFESKAPMALQELYLSCKEVFKGPGTVPLPRDVERLCHLLDKMKPEDVGLSSALQFFQPKTAVKCTPRVTTTTIYKCDKFSLCIFFLPATAVIPLHNHPGMTVFSKLLLGTMHIKSYDWVSPPSADEPVQPSNLRLAKLVTESVFEAPCNTSVLYPTTGGNIHQFTAITPCAVLDVLGPPYSKEDGRDCSHYKDHPCSAISNGEMKLTEEEGNSYGWLEEIEMPENSQMDGIRYLGPQIVESRD